MNCLLTYIILILLIIFFLLNNESLLNITDKSNIKETKKICSIPAYVKAQDTSFVKDNNNYQYNHTTQEKMNNLRHIECSTEQLIDKYIDKFLEMDYDKDIDNIVYDKLDSIIL